MQPDVVSFSNADALAEGAADRIARFLRHHAGEVVTLGVAGGSTPANTYRVLTELDVPWNRVYAWVGDERFVPPGHEDHNGTMADRLLLEGTGATFFPVPWQDGADPGDLAADYERTLIEILDPDMDGPRPDLLLAGIGDDGHTLSLFPETAALEVRDRWFVANHVPQKDTWRLTATYPLAWRARQILVLVSGEGKAPALARILAGDSTLPAQRLMEHGTVTWLADEAALSAWENA